MDARERQGWQWLGWQWAVAAAGDVASRGAVTVCSVWAGHMLGISKICSELTAKARRLGVGESSGECVGVVYC